VCPTFRLSVSQPALCLTRNHHTKTSQFTRNMAVESCVPIHAPPARQGNGRPKPSFVPCAPQGENQLHIICIRLEAHFTTFSCLDDSSRCSAVLAATTGVFTNNLETITRYSVLHPGYVRGPCAQEQLGVPNSQNGLHQALAFWTSSTLSQPCPFHWPRQETGLHKLGECWSCGGVWLCFWVSQACPCDENSLSYSMHLLASSQQRKIAIVRLMPRNAGNKTSVQPQLTSLLLSTITTPP